MKVTIEFITPALALKYMSFNDINRKMRPAVVALYASEMSAGTWTQCPEPISFYADGALADGQHRLKAIIESGVGQTFTVVRGLTREDGLNINTGLGRSVIDGARISGVDESVTNVLIAVARAIEEGTRASGKVSNAVKLALVNDHREAAEFGVSCGSRGARSTIYMAACGRAWYMEKDIARLQRLADIVHNGVSLSADETAAITLRDFIHTHLGNMAYTNASWRDGFLRVQNAIWYFMRRRPLSLLKQCSEEAYPLNGQQRNLSYGSSRSRTSTVSSIHA